MSITVDTNAAETPLALALQERLLGRTTIARARLDLGDVRLATDELVMLVERKTWADWAASVRDGRYKEQKARFLGSLPTGDDEGAPKTRLIYLLEGALVGFDGDQRGMSNRALNAAVLKTQLRDGITVLRTRDAAHSADSLAYLLEQMRAGGLDPRAAKVGGAGGAKKRKRENLEEPAALFRAMLAVVPGMSDEKAAAVASEFPSFRALRRATVDTLKLVECGARARKLGPAVAKRIVALYDRDGRDGRE